MWEMEGFNNTALGDPNPSTPNGHKTPQCLLFIPPILKLPFLTHRDASSAPESDHVAKVTVWGSRRDGPHCWIRLTQLILLVDAGDAPGLGRQTLGKGRGEGVMKMGKLEGKRWRYSKLEVGQFVKMFCWVSLHYSILNPFTADFL